MHPPQSQRIPDHADRGQRHRRGRDDRRQKNAEHRVQGPSSDGHTGSIVKEGEEQVLADIAHGRLGETACAHDAGEIAFQQRHACALDGDVGARSHGNADFRCGKGRRIVDAIASHRDDPPFLTKPFDYGALLVGQHLGFHIGDPEALRHRLRGRVVVAGQHHDTHTLFR